MALECHVSLARSSLTITTTATSQPIAIDAKQVDDLNRNLTRNLAAEKEAAEQKVALSGSIVSPMLRSSRSCRNLPHDTRTFTLHSRQHREHLHHLSTTRVKTWNNTIASQSRQRKQEREAVLAAEEAARVKVDVAHARDEAARRDAMIQRAKALLLYENDHVKNVHVQFVMDQVLMV